MELSPLAAVHVVHRKISAVAGKPRRVKLFSKPETRNSKLAGVPMSLDIRSMTPLLQVYDMPTSMDFYCKTLGFVIVTVEPPLVRSLPNPVVLSGRWDAGDLVIAADPVQIVRDAADPFAVLDELPALAGGIDLGALYALAESLCRQGMA